MTSQTKKFIELSDVISLRLKCKSCASELLIPSSRDIDNREEQGKLSECPVCRKDWALVNGSTCESTIAKFMSSLNKLRAEMKSFPAGFFLAFEINNDEVPNDEKK
jgi:hypothetical protein